MAIDFDDPAQTTHNDQPIPINTQEKYDAAEAIVESAYAYFGVEYGDEAQAQFERRVRSGQGLKEILANTLLEYSERADVPIAAPTE